jgi:hypothetical protein
LEHNLEARGYISRSNSLGLKVHGLIKQLQPFLRSIVALLSCFTSHRYPSDHGTAFRFDSAIPFDFQFPELIAQLAPLPDRHLSWPARIFYFAFESSPFLLHPALSRLALTGINDAADVQTGGEIVSPQVADLEGPTFGVDKSPSMAAKIGFGAPQLNRLFDSTPPQDELVQLAMSQIGLFQSPRWHWLAVLLQFAILDTAVLS